MQSESLNTTTHCTITRTNHTKATGMCVLNNKISRTFRSLLGRPRVIRKLGDFLFEEMSVAFVIRSTTYHASRNPKPSAQSYLNISVVQKGQRHDFEHDSMCVCAYKSACMCMHVSVNVCMFVCMYVCMHICMYVCFILVLPHQMH